ncbi:SDR family NAD(P)-dependent oxidoreductase [Nocardia sp. SYP-A9097]|uniref:nocobactin polyketide synthase NbtC n=1 Tax=Nocardia sp. SYP-A9097 TaxID=2663237 RepID=UPI00129BA1E2|nr:nocobactin polyketide synthase NbtC [Nocardia sp. SYP-A9097]MRH91597.1 SDR family NAD(P)-dependent oxidoreductase [Nocardia sp. SYP-A9097]
MPDYRLPDGSTPILLSADTVDVLQREAAALAAYLEERPTVTPDAVADMLFRTRAPRRYRALAAVTHREQLLEALQAIAAGRPYPAVIAGNRAATARRIAYVFPGQGSQRPGMGVLYYRYSQVFRATVDECDAIFRAQHGISPLTYLLDEAGAVTENVEIVQPALFMQMLGLAAIWRAAGVEPHLTVGHSQGEIAAAVVSDIISLADGIRVVTLRAEMVGSLERANDWNGRWAMAVVGIERDECEALLARNSGWAELAVVNSAHVLAVSGERPAVAALVANLTAQGKFAKEIRVEYPAHTSFVSKFREELEGALHDTLDAPVFAPTEIPCIGSTLGEAITPDLPPAEYWYWNLRNRVRFDLAIAEAVARDIDIFLEIADHPALMVAMQDTLSTFGAARDFRTIGTSRRTATNLTEFTKNLAQLAVLDTAFPWDSLRDTTTDIQRLPLLDFPNTQTTPKQLWAPFDYSQTAQSGLPTPAGTPEIDVAAPQSPQSRRDDEGSAQSDRSPADPITEPVMPGTVVPQRLSERWVRLDRRKLIPPRTLTVIDHTGRRADLAAAIEQAAPRHGATVVGISSAATFPTDRRGPVSATSADAAAVNDTVVILLPTSAAVDIATAVRDSAEFVGGRGWLPDLTGVRDVWLVTSGGEQVLDGETPDIAHAAAQAGFRCLAAEYPGVGFRHLDLAAGQELAEAAKVVLGAVHTAGEPELAARSGAWYAKRLVLDETPGDCPLTSTDLDEVMIIGGTGALGLDCAADFARAGARRITLISRSGGSAEAKARVREMNSLGAIVDIRTCDVTDDDSVRALGDEFVLTPVSLLVHAAVDYAAAAAEVSPETVCAAAESKVIALDRMIRDLPLAPDARVVLCSSLSATIGGRGHSVYAAVNRMLDAAATGYRRDGIGVTSVQWGLWHAVGADNADALARISGIGLLPMDPATAIAAGFAAPGNSLVAAAEWSTLRAIFALYGQDPLFADLPDRPVAQPTTTGSATPAAVAPTPQDIAVQVQDALRFVMGMDHTEPIDGSMPLVALGLDSLQALDLRKLIETQLQRELPVTAILGGASLDEVVALLG